MFPQPVCYPSVNAPGAVFSRHDSYEPGANAGGWGVDESRCNRTYSNKIRMEISPQYVGPAQVIMLSGVRIGDTYRYPLCDGFPTETDTGSFVQAIHAERVSIHDPSGVVMWEVTIEYSPFDVRYNLGLDYISMGVIDPTQKIAEISFDKAKFEITLPFDRSDPPKPYVNSIGAPLLDPPPHEETRSVMSISLVRPKFTDMSPWENTTNQDIFLGWPPNTVKCRTVKVERTYDPDWGIPYKYTVEFEFRVDIEGVGWTQRLVNVGTKYKKGGTGKPIKFYDDNGHPDHEPRMLKKDGDLLPDGDDPYLLEFVEFPPADFNFFGIPPELFQLDI